MFPYPKVDFNGVKSIKNYKSSEEMIKEYISKYPLIHSVEIITDNHNFPIFDNFKRFFHVLLKPDIFFSEDSSILFDPSTKIISLTPIQKGNFFYVGNGQIYIFVNDPTYRRLGIQGKSCNDHHLITITNENKGKLMQIQYCQPIEVLMYCDDSYVHTVQNYFTKMVEERVKITESKISNENIDLSAYKTEETYIHNEEKNWKIDICGINDKLLLQRFSMGVTDEKSFKHIKYIGPIVTEDLLEYLLNNMDGFVCTMFWEFKDSIPIQDLCHSKFFTVGGRTLSLFYGTYIARSISIQNYEAISDE